MTEQTKKEILDGGALVLRQEADALHAFANVLGELHAFAEAVVLCAQATRQGHMLVLSGMGKSGIIAQKIAATLRSTGSPAYFLHPSDAMHGDIGALRAGDVLLALSQSGSSEELCRTMHQARQFGVRCLGVTAAPQSRFASLVDTCIVIPDVQEACPLGLAPSTSTTLMLALGDALAFALMKEHGTTREDFARSHPSGALGRKVLVRVASVMQKPPAHVYEKTPMRVLLAEATEKKQGAVCIVGVDFQLRGIITDGDIRRALLSQPELLALEADTLMNSSPLTIFGDMFVDEALQLMEQRSSQISVLPVLDRSGQLIGLFRLHDVFSHNQ